jgi:pSer/pThr/pTyr-binding forkhead associated (FHA) protein
MDDKEGNETYVIGAARGVDIRIDKENVSSRHARLTRVGRGYILEDLQSTNGTFVDGNRITTRAVTETSAIGLGSYTVTLAELLGKVDSRRDRGGAEVRQQVPHDPPIAAAMSVPQQPQPQLAQQPPYPPQMQQPPYPQHVQQPGYPQRAAPSSSGPLAALLIVGGIIAIGAIAVGVVRQVASTEPYVSPPIGGGDNPVPLPPPPHPLPYEITLCDLKPTGPLGLGDDRVAVVTVLNEGDQRGIFIVHVQGEYPGGGLIEHQTDQLPIPALDKRTSKLRFTPNDGMIGIMCTVDPPMVN